MHRWTLGAIWASLVRTTIVAPPSRSTLSRSTSLLSLNLDVLSMVMSYLDQRTLLLVTRTCKLGRAIGMRFLVADVQVELHHVSGFVAFMLSPANQTRLPPLLRRLTVSKNHLQVALARMTFDGSDHDMERRTMYSIAGRSLAHLFKYSRNLSAVDIAGLEVMLDQTDPFLADALADLSRLRSISFHSPKCKCEELTSRLKHITHLAVQLVIAPYVVPTRFDEGLSLIRPLAEVLTTVSLQGAHIHPKGPVGQLGITFPNVTALHLSEVSAFLVEILDMFPSIKKLVLDDSELSKDRATFSDVDKVTKKPIDFISTDQHGLIHVAVLCQPHILAVTCPNSNASAFRMDLPMESVVELIKKANPYGLSIAWPLENREPLNLSQLDWSLPEDLECLDLTLTSSGLSDYVINGDHVFFESFRTSAPLIYLHITVQRGDVARTSGLSAAPSMFRSVTEGTLLPPLAEMLPSLQYVTVEWAEEGRDIMSWRIFNEGAGEIVVQRMKAYEGRAMKEASLAVPA